MNCVNCNNYISKEDKYCSFCGNKVIAKRLSFKVLMLGSLYQFLNFDNKFFKTFIHLLTNPSEVVDAYVKGNRSKYLNPINYFAFALSISGLQILIIRKFFIDIIDFTTFGSASDSEISRRIMELSFDFQPLLFAIQIPILAGIAYILFKKYRYNFSEHLVLFTYTQCEYSIITFPINLLILLFIPEKFSSIGLLLTFFILLYSLYVLFNLFKLTLKGKLLKSILLILLYFIVFNLIIFSVGFFLIRFNFI